MHQKRRIGSVDQYMALYQRNRRKHEHQCHEAGEQRIPELRKQELELQPRGQLRHVMPRILQQNGHQTARPLEFLHDEVGKSHRPVAMGDGVHGMDAAPATGIHQKRGGMIFGKLRPKAANLPQSLRAHGIMRTDAKRRPAIIVAQLQCAMQACLGI